MKMFEGTMRKVAVVLVIGTALGWFLIVIGFGIGSNQGDVVAPINLKSKPYSYPLWTACFCGPPLFLAALLHAALAKPLGALFGSITAVLTVFFITSLGMILYENGNIIRQNNEAGVYRVDIPGWFDLEFAAALICLLFWTPLMALWSQYDRPKVDNYTDVEVEFQ